MDKWKCAVVRHSWGAQVTLIRQGEYVGAMAMSEEEAKVLARLLEAGAAQEEGVALRVEWGDVRGIG